jgi:outer membrane immunogenic protein
MWSRGFVLRASAGALVFACASGAQFPAFATDVYGPVAGTPMAPWFTWTGPYVGGNVGGAFGSDLPGVIGGGQIGANLQVGRGLIGIELDADGSSQSSATTIPVGFTSLTRKDSVPWFGTARLRGGTVIAGGWMSYITAGVGSVDFKTELSGPVGNSTWERSRVAWTVGLGVEYALMWNLSLKGEVLYLDAGSFSTKANFGALTIPVNASLQHSVARIGANYHF